LEQLPPNFASQDAVHSGMGAPQPSTASLFIGGIFTKASDCALHQLIRLNELKFQLAGNQTHLGILKHLVDECKPCEDDCREVYAALLDGAEDETLMSQSNTL
jgi:hypothetical protein